MGRVVYITSVIVMFDMFDSLCLVELSRVNTCIWVCSVPVSQSVQCDSPSGINHELCESVK